MARNYGSHGSVTVGTNKTGVSMVPTAAIRPKIYEIVIGCPAAPAAQAALWYFQRFTAEGTATAFTPVPLDPADPASLVTSGTNHSVEPTYTAGAIAWQLPLNQQATYTAKMNAGKEIVLAASATSGGGLKTSSATGAAVHNASLFWEE